MGALLGSIEQLIDPVFGVQFFQVDKHSPLDVGRQIYVIWCGEGYLVGGDCSSGRTGHEIVFSRPEILGDMV